MNFGTGVTHNGMLTDTKVIGWHGIVQSVSRDEGLTRDMDVREYIQHELAAELNILMRKEEDSHSHFDQDVNEVSSVEKSRNSGRKIRGDVSTEMRVIRL